ncbi:hypothetical protein BDL97_15G010700 [Sphagnum fallax]|nr:hypothetical protein BDL97_15G010700 [Sphagnum fallax]KAH8938955.1 hypothetical protein BDL97_15G010700 [Sphagnum fallax]
MEVQLITTSVIPSSAVLVTASLRTRKLDLYVKPLGLPRFGIIMKSSIQVPSSRGRRRRRQGLGFGGLQSVVTCAEKEDEEKELLEPAPRIDGETVIRIELTGSRWEEIFGSRPLLVFELS